MSDPSTPFPWKQCLARALFCRSDDMRFTGWCNQGASTSCAHLGYLTLSSDAKEKHVAIS